MSSVVAASTTYSLRDIRSTVNGCGSTECRGAGVHILGSGFGVRGLRFEGKGCEFRGFDNF
jgi:hypothetical protein